MHQLTDTDNTSSTLETGSREKTKVEAVFYFTNPEVVLTGTFERGDPTSTTANSNPKPTSINFGNGTSWTWYA
jgi:hypothetical protein